MIIDLRQTFNYLVFTGCQSNLIFLQKEDVNYRNEQNSLRGRLGLIKKTFKSVNIVLINEL